MNIEAKLQEVREEYSRRLVSGSAGLLLQVEHYIASAQGKFLRPHLLLSAAASLGEKAFHSRRTLLLAVAVEMLHNASLLHDDVVDRAESRRGLPSVNHRWSPAVAVLVGDYLLAQTMLILHECNDADATLRLNQTVAAMVESELLAQEQPVPDSPLSYLRIIDGKTARLFATACALGNPAFEPFGLHFGRLFQLRDDIADHETTPFTAQLLASEEAALQNLGLSLPDFPYNPAP